MSEKYFVFLKNNRVMNIAVFSTQNEELADAIAKEQGYDDAIWVGENLPVMFSTWDGSKFNDPTLDDLYDMGVAQENTAIMNVRLAEEAARKARLSEPSV